MLCYLMLCPLENAHELETPNHATIRFCKSSDLENCAADSGQHCSDFELRWVGEFRSVFFSYEFCSVKAIRSRSQTDFFGDKLQKHNLQIMSHTSS